MKKLIVFLLVAVMTLGSMPLAACSTTDYTVGIIQLVPHPALDDATNGFRDALGEEMEKAGKTVKFDYQNASNETSACTTIVGNFKAKKYDLIMANATAALQAAANAVTDIPILGTSVTEYGVALGIDNFNGTVGGNVSGTSDLGDLDSQAQMILDLVPSAKKVALLYCSAEPNSKYQVLKVAEYLSANGVESKEYPFADTNDLSAVATGAADYGDAIYVPTDNTVAANTETIDAVCRPKKKPIIAGEEGICGGCGIATLSISYYQLGVKTGKMAAEILLRGADISKMPVQYDDSAMYKYNAEICEALGITVPENYVKIEKKAE